MDNLRQIVRRDSRGCVHDFVQRLRLGVIVALILFIVLPFILR